MTTGKKRWRDSITVDRTESRGTRKTKNARINWTLYIHVYILTSVYLYLKRGNDKPKKGKVEKYLQILKKKYSLSRHLCLETINQE